MAPGKNEIFLGLMSAVRSRAVDANYRSIGWSCAKIEHAGEPFDSTRQDWRVGGTAIVSAGSTSSSHRTQTRTFAEDSSRSG